MSNMFELTVQKKRSLVVLSLMLNIQKLITLFQLSPPCFKLVRGAQTKQKYLKTLLYNNHNYWQKCCVHMGQLM